MNRFTFLFLIFASLVPAQEQAPGLTREEAEAKVTELWREIAATRSKSFKAALESKVIEAAG